MMDRKPKKELIEGIRDALRDFEEPYDPKEWEYFQQQRKAKIKKRKFIPLWVKLTGIAACISFMVYAAVRILPFFNEIHKSGNKAMEQASDSSFAKEHKVTGTVTLDSVSSASTLAYPLHKEEINKLKPPRQSPGLIRKKVLQNPNAITSTFDTISTPDSGSIPRKTLNKFNDIPFLKDLQENKMSLPEKLTTPVDSQLPKLNTLSRGQINRRYINAGFNIDLGFSEKGLLYGGGVSVQIPLSGRLLAEIGVSYSRMTIGTDMEVDKPDTISLHKIGIRHTLGMASLPISLHYVVSDGFSVALGMKPFMVVTDQRTDIYLSYKWIPPDISSNTSIGRLVSERHELRRSDSLYKNKAYLGFVQLSGYISPPFLRKHNAVIAPYIAIPVGDLQNDPYKWVHGGVSFRIYLSKP